MSCADFDRHFAPLLRPFAPPQSEVHSAPPLHVVSMEEQRRMALANANADAWAKVRHDIDRCHQQEADAGEHS